MKLLTLTTLVTYSSLLAVNPMNIDLAEARLADQKLASTLRIASATKSARTYPPQVVKNFVDACTAGRGAAVQAVCTCAIKKIQQRYTLAEFTRYDEAVAQGSSPPQDMVDIVKSCRQVSEPSSGRAYPPQVVKNFVDACTDGRGADVRAVCTCSIKKIQQRYTLAEFTRIDEEVGRGRKTPQAIIDIVKSCGT